MSKQTDGDSEEAVNWEPPKKIDLVERAISDGITEPAAIIEWANQYKVSLTVEDVLGLKAEIEKRNKSSH